MLSNLDKMFRNDLALICESHHLDDLDDFSKYKVNVSYGNDAQETVNINYIAIILRIADLLHITRDRTPSISRKIINVTNPISVVEWEKQKAVRAVKPQSRRTSDGRIDEDLEKNTIEITAYFEGAETAEAYFGLSAYLQYTKKELEQCCRIISKAQKYEGTIEYLFPWNNIDESQIVAVGFEPKKLQFTIAQDNILQLLVGHTLYNDSSVVVRELVQNGIDAVKLQQCIDKKNQNCITNGKILVQWDSCKRELSFWDNGTGMTILDIENYLLKVGASKYREDSIIKNFPNFTSISHFGIGILTCFMVANDIDIITNSVEQEDASIISLRKVNGSYLLKKVPKDDLNPTIRHHGTMVKLHIRSDVDMTNLYEDLRKWIVLPEIPVYLKENSNDEVRIGFDHLSDILKKYLDEIGCSADGIKYDVYERTHGNVTVAFAVRHLPYLSDWCLMNVDQRRIFKKGVLPIGTCVEGIRVEFTTPGFESTSILAIANIKDSKYQTNVARSAIELDANKEIVSDIYTVFAEYVQEQMDSLEVKEYSQSWAISEGRYLMSPLFSSRINNGNSQPIDEEILIRCMAGLKCILLENDGNRSVISAEEISHKDEINIYECKMTQAAEFLLKETRCDATLINLISAVCPSDNFMINVPNIICNYDEFNVLHRYALRNMEVSDLEINRKYRRIHLTYKNNIKLWDRFELHGRMPNQTLHIPQKDFVIKGLEDEIGVQTANGIFVSSNSEIYQFLRETIDSFLEEDTVESRYLLSVFLSGVFDPRILETTYKESTNPNSVFKQFLEDKYTRLSENLFSKMLDKIDIDVFAKNILGKNYHLYSIENWSRHKDSI